MIRPIFTLALIALPALASAQILPPRADHQPDRKPLTPAPRSGPCADPEYHQFDFWVGRWQVVPTGASKQVAASVIEKLYDGCAIRENWIPIGQAGGGSLSSYVKAEHAWRQTWVDSSGSRAEFKGGWNGQAMVLTGPWPLPDGRARLVRMTYTPGPDGSVRQAGEASFDDGRSWRPTFDFTYRRAPAVIRPQPFLK
jgi:hypothetical protein